MILNFERLKIKSKLCGLYLNRKYELVPQAQFFLPLVNEWQTEAIREGIRQADAGELIDHKDIREKWETKLAYTMD